MFVKPQFLIVPHRLRARPAEIASCWEAQLFATILASAFLSPFRACLLPCLVRWQSHANIHSYLGAYILTCLRIQASGKQDAMRRGILSDQGKTRSMARRFAARSTIRDDYLHYRTVLFRVIRRHRTIRRGILPDLLHVAAELRKSLARAYSTSPRATI